MFSSRMARRMIAKWRASGQQLRLRKHRRSVMIVARWNCRGSNRLPGAMLCVWGGNVSVSTKAGKPADPSILVNVPRLVTAYYAVQPDPSDPAQQVVFGTSGHRGSSFHGSFNEWHILAITQAICDYRKLQKIDGPLFLGIDTHALSEPAFASALEVLAANNVEVMVSEGTAYTPTPAVSHAILQLQPRAEDGTCRRHRDHAVPQSSGRWRLQVRPSARWTSRSPRNLLDRIEGQRISRGAN